MKNFQEQKATLMILAIVLVFILLITIPVLLNNNEKEDKEDFPSYTKIDIKSDGTSLNNYDEVKNKLENDYNFKKEVLINDYDYENYTSIDIQNLLWNYIFSYELNNTKYLSSISDTKFCLREQYVIDSFNELYNIDISNDLNLLPGYYKYVTKDKRKYCFNYQNVSKEYNNDTKLGIDSINVNDDIVTINVYLYEYYIMNTASELSNVSELERYISMSDFNNASKVVTDYLSGKVTHKQLKFKINNSAKFYKYQILSSKKLDY